MNLNPKKALAILAILFIFALALTATYFFKVYVELEAMQAVIAGFGLTAVIFVGGGRVSRIFYEVGRLPPLFDLFYWALDTLGQVESTISEEPHACSYIPQVIAYTVGKKKGQNQEVAAHIAHCPVCQLEYQRLKDDHS